MRRLLIYTAILISLNSCTKDLVSIDYSEINPAIFPQSEADVEAMVNACYYPLRGAWWDGINTTSERGVMFAADATTEILSGKYDIQQYGHLLNFTPASEQATFFYDWYYNKISLMTLTIDLINESKVNDEVKRKAIAEVRCARGYLAYT